MFPLFHVHGLNVPYWVDEEFMRASELVNNELVVLKERVDLWRIIGIFRIG